MNDTQPRIETDRLILRPFTQRDADAVMRLAGDREIADTTLNIPHPYKEGMAEDWISTHREGIESGDSLTLAITLTDTGELVGAVGLTVQKEHSRAELGYWTGRQYWGLGYCTEAARALVEYGFDKMELNRIYASHFSGNTASGRVMEKLGMKHEGIMRQHVRKEGSYVDLVIYGITRKQYA